MSEEDLLPSSRSEDGGRCGDGVSGSGATCNERVC